jgi:LPS sulfotransferase NodH
MPSSRAIVVLGMHRSGTSLLTRGLQALGVFLGDDFLATRPDNPTGYWEDKRIVELNEKLLSLLGLNWESISLIDESCWQRDDVQALIGDAVAYLQSNFLSHPLWGFKDPRTVRLLPFWKEVFQRAGVDDRYVLAIRHPLGVANSLARRQCTEPGISHLLSLVYLVPFLRQISSRPVVVTDYDLLMEDPSGQLQRIARGLDLPIGEPEKMQLEEFSRAFLDPALRHGYFSRHDFDTVPVVSALIREAYFRLFELATDRLTFEAAEFWTAWEYLEEAVAGAVAEYMRDHPTVGLAKEIKAVSSPQPATSNPASTQPALTEVAPESARVFRFKDQAIFHGSGVIFFVVVGAQRTGTNLLREVLNTNPQIAMLGEVLSPSSAPAHWENFLRSRADAIFPAQGPVEMEALLDRYFQFVLYRIRNHWADGQKSQCRAVGVDIKYNQLRRLAPLDWDPANAPFLLKYLQARGAVFIHATRDNVIHCAISAMIAAQRNFWHNYEGAIIDRRFAIDIDACLESAQVIVGSRAAFADAVKNCHAVECGYEELVAQIALAGSDGIIPESRGPLASISRALGVGFDFRYDGRLQKAINVPYSQLLLNQKALEQAIRQSEFSRFAESLQ